MIPIENTPIVLPFQEDTSDDVFAEKAACELWVKLAYMTLCKPVLQFSSMYFFMIFFYVYHLNTELTLTD